MATLKDIATATGVSLQTVGHILKPGSSQRSRYAAPTVAKVDAAAQRLGWRPNQAARAMQRGRFGAVTLLLSHHQQRSHVPIATMRALVATLAAHGVDLVLSLCDDDALQDPSYVPDLLQRQGSDGLIVAYTSEVPPAVDHLIERIGIPTVWFNAGRADDDVAPDDHGAGLALGRWLATQITGPVLFVDHGGGIHSSIADRATGVAAGYGGPVRSITAAIGDHGERYRWALDHLATTPAAAIVAYGTTTLMPCAHAAARLGQQPLLATFSGEPVWWDGTPVATARIPEADLGVALAATLLAKIAQPTVALPSRRLPCTLVLPESPC